MQTFAEFWASVNVHVLSETLRRGDKDSQRFGQRLFNEAPKEFGNAVHGTRLDTFYLKAEEVGELYSELEAVWNEVVK